tara:strand:+ start:1830 stop:2030 length:201 start_codon:yes stop_codon:yes gene_type:complete
MTQPIKNAADIRKELIASLVLVQNHPVHQNHDIMTFAGMCTTEEVRAHLEACIRQISNVQLCEVRA